MITKGKGGVDEVKAVPSVGQYEDVPGRSACVHWFPVPDIRVSASFALVSGCLYHLYTILTVGPSIFICIRQRPWCMR
jgi:hypothetical protein